MIEKITNQSLESYAKQNLFDKLGLISTSFVWEENVDKQIATGHNAKGECNERKNIFTAMLLTRFIQLQMNIRKSFWKF